MEETPDRISVTRGEKFKVELKAVPTAGYRWQTKYDDTYIKLISDDIKPISDKMGSGGLEQFVFHSTKSGDTMIEMSYKRPWEKGFSKQKKIFVNIK
jgi:predicted secreted protein